MLKFIGFWFLICFFYVIYKVIFRQKCKTCTYYNIDIYSRGLGRCICYGSDNHNHILEQSKWCYNYEKRWKND
jgi:hypothetical protein